jgi:hypothetical protein
MFFVNRYKKETKPRDFKGELLAALVRVCYFVATNFSWLNTNNKLGTQ